MWFGAQTATRLATGLALISMLGSGGARAASPAPLSLAGIAWMEGHWVMEDERGRAEEIWMAPLDGSMVGSFRWALSDGPHVLEFLVIEELADGVFFRFKHFDKAYRPWEKDAPNTYRLTEATADRAVFVSTNWNGRVPQRMIYTHPAPGRLTFRGESPDVEGEPLVLEFTERRALAVGSDR